MRRAGKQWDRRVPKSRGAVGGWPRRCGDAAPLPTQTRRLRELTRAESNLLLKIRIYTESSGGTKLSTRTATGLHSRSRLKSCMRNTWKLARKKRKKISAKFSALKKKERKTFYVPRECEESEHNTKVHKYLHFSLLFLLKNKNNLKRLRAKHSLKKVPCVGRPQAEKRKIKTLTLTKCSQPPRKHQRTVQKAAAGFPLSRASSPPFTRSFF